jgi:hypothetical protein
VQWWVVSNAGGRFAVAASSRSQAAADGTIISGPYSSQAAAQAAISSGSGSSGGTSGSAGSTGSSGSSGSSGCGARAIYQALLSAGFSTPQAVGAMANAIAESSLDAEARVRDSNGYMSNGLWQFNEQSYPTSAGLVTGNCSRDIAQQVGFLKSVVPGAALNGSTGAEVAGNFAASFERCQGCSAGSTAANGWSTRVGNAAKVEGWIQSGNWPAASVSSVGGTSGSTGTAAGTASAACALSVSLPLTGQVCLLTKSQARGAMGALLMVAGGLIALPGIVMLAAAGLGTPAAQVARGAIGRVPVVRMTTAAMGDEQLEAAAPAPGQAAPVIPGAAPAPAAAPRYPEVADEQGTSPEFRRRFLGG